MSSPSAPEEASARLYCLDGVAKSVLMLMKLGEPIGARLKRRATHAPIKKVFLFEDGHHFVQFF